MASLVNYCLVAGYLFIHFCSAEAIPTSPFLCYFALIGVWATSILALSLFLERITEFKSEISKYLINIKYNLRRRSQFPTSFTLQLYLFLFSDFSVSNISMLPS